MSTSAAISAYNKVGLESGVTAADPHKLISMLYQGALLAIANAKNGILRNDIPAKGKAISHAILIIDSGLNASLNKEVGGDLALNLAALYDYMSGRLLVANLNNDMEALNEVARLLGELKEAWESIRQAATTPTAALTMPAQASQLVYAKG
jgi:flagellar protein FliS